MLIVLQIDSIGEPILWGDAGVGNFFISKEDLINKDFSRVLYNWDYFKIKLVLFLYRKAQADMVEETFLLKRGWQLILY